MQAQLKNVTRLVSQLALSALVVATTNTFAAQLCADNTLAKLRATVANSDAYTARLILSQQKASSLRQRIMDARAALEKNQEANLTAQIGLFSVPASSYRSQECSQLSQSQYYNMQSFQNTMYGISYSQRYAGEALNQDYFDFSSKCVTQATLDLEAAVRKDLADVANMYKPTPLGRSLCSLLPK